MKSSELEDARRRLKTGDEILPWEWRLLIKVGAPISEVAGKPRPMIPSNGTSLNVDESEVIGEKYCLEKNGVSTSADKVVENILPSSAESPNSDSIGVDGTRGAVTTAVPNAEVAILLGGGRRLGRVKLRMGGASLLLTGRRWNPKIGRAAT